MKLDSRPLSADEEAVLTRLLTPDFPGVEALRGQRVGLRVVGRCNCGCPSVELTPRPGSPASDQVGRLSPVELAVAPLGDEPPGNIILFVDDGKLSYMEYVHYSDRPPEAWPSPQRLSVVPRG